MMKGLVETSQRVWEVQRLGGTTGSRESSTRFWVSGLGRNPVSEVFRQTYAVRHRGWVALGGCGTRCSMLQPVLVLRPPAANLPQFYFYRCPITPASLLSGWVGGWGEPPGPMKQCQPGADWLVCRVLPKPLALSLSTELGPWRG